MTPKNNLIWLLICFQRIQIWQKTFDVQLLYFKYIYTHIERKLLIVYCFFNSFMMLYDHLIDTKPFNFLAKNKLHVRLYIYGKK